MKPHKWILPLLLALLPALGHAVTLPLMPWQDADRELLEALKDRNLARFEALLKNGANPNAFFVSKHGFDEWVMCDATEQDALDFLKLALKHGGDVNLYNPDDYSFPRPIFCAIINGNVDAVYLLADNGAELAVDKHLRVPPADTPLVGAASYALWDAAYWMLKKREGQVGEQEIKYIIRNLERGDGSLNPNTENDVWRFRVLEYLAAKGYKIKPHMGEVKCRQSFSKTLQRYLVAPRICRDRNAKFGDIIYIEDPNLYRQDWERAKAGGPRPEPR